MLSNVLHMRLLVLQPQLAEFVQLPAPLSLSLCPLPNPLLSAYTISSCQPINHLCWKLFRFYIIDLIRKSYFGKNLSALCTEKTCFFFPLCADKVSRKWLFGSLRRMRFDFSC